MADFTKYSLKMQIIIYKWKIRIRLNCLSAHLYCLTNAMKCSCNLHQNLLWSVNKCWYFRATVFAVDALLSLFLFLQLDLLLFSLFLSVCTLRALPFALCDDDTCDDSHYINILEAFNHTEPFWIFIKFTDIFI